MALISHRKGAHGTELEHKPFDVFDSFFSDWPSMFRRPFVVVPEGAGGIRSDEFTEDGMLVVQVEMAGIDPEKDVEVSLEGDVVHIDAERSEEAEVKERDYTRRELRSASFRRDVPVPAGTKESDVKASYKDGILEVRVPTVVEPPPPESTKISVQRS